MKLLIIHSCIFLFCITSCTTPEHFAVVSDTIPYKMHSSSEEAALLCVNSLSYGILSQQSLVVNVTLKNQSARMVNIFPSTLMVTSPEGVRTPATLASADTIVMGLEDTAILNAMFLPVNSRFLYHYAMLRGDIHPEYKISISGQSDSGDAFEESISLLTDTTFYSRSLKKFGNDFLITPFHISGIAENEDTGLAVLENGQTEIVIRDNEILKEGFWIKMLAYQQYDTLHCRLRFVNQSLFSVSITPKELKLNTSSASIEPHVRSSGELVLRKGDRAEVDLKFSVRIASGYTLDFRSIKRLDAPGKILFSDLFSLEQLQAP
jgi:hypothetical protein